MSVLCRVVSCRGQGFTRPYLWLYNVGSTTAGSKGPQELVELQVLVEQLVIVRWQSYVALVVRAERTSCRVMCYEGPSSGFFLPDPRNLISNEILISIGLQV